MNSIVIRNCLIYLEDNLVIRDLFIERGIIKFSKSIPDEDCEIIEGNCNYVVSHGFIDIHTHLRDPGFLYKETMESGTKSAVAGGYTSVCSMPNLNPVPDNELNLDLQISIIEKKAKCKVYPFMSITKERKNNSLSDFYKIYKKNPNKFIGITNDGDSVEDLDLMSNAFKIASEHDILIASHCEFKTTYPKPESEYEYLKRDIKLLEKYKCRYHVQHVSCKESINLIRNAKLKGLPITCEVTPHHLILCNDEIDYNSKNSGSYKVSPPLRSIEDRKTIQEAFKDGTIDAIATDHAPHSFCEKNKGFENSLNGIVGLEISFSIIYNEMVKLNSFIGLNKLLFLLTTGPSRVIGLNSRIKEGDIADLVLIDLSSTIKIDPDSFYTLGRSTPFSGYDVLGKIFMVIHNGKILFKNGVFRFEDICK